MKAAIESAGLGLTTTLLGNGTLQINDLPPFTIDTSLAPKLIRTAAPSGVNPIAFIQDSSFTASDVNLAIIDAINTAVGTSLIASNRDGATLFVENAISVSSEIDNYYLRGVADLAGNLLKPNRINDETQFTLIMPGAVPTTAMRQIRSLQLAVVIQPSMRMMAHVTYSAVLLKYCWAAPSRVKPTVRQRLTLMVITETTELPSIPPLCPIAANSIATSLPVLP